MKAVQSFGKIYGWRNPRLADQPNDDVALQSLYTVSLPKVLVNFLDVLSDCILYYAVDVPTRTGRPKRFSHFVTTNIGPDPASPYPFPSSLINRVSAWRKSGLSPDALPIMVTSGGSGRWIFCRLLGNSVPVVIARGDREFGSCDKEWNEIDGDFSSFVERLTFDASPLLSAFRVAGTTSHADDSIRYLLAATMGSDWETQVAKSL